LQLSRFITAQTAVYYDYSPQTTTQQKQKQQHDPVANPQSGSDNPLSARDRVHLKSAIDHHAAQVGDCF
jgi:hypothetical protein